MIPDGIPIGHADSTLQSPVGRGPSGIAVRNYFLSASRQEFFVFPVELFVTARS
jgi:hypothetical protein